jgi:DMSO/TMAO reductase YedYZ molybdopterin-dependent catalytic subunit
METSDVSRRALLKGGGAAVAGATVLQVSGPTQAFAANPDDEEVLPWQDQPDPSPEPPTALYNLLEWEDLDSWLTPADGFFVVNHYDEQRLSASDWRLRVDGLVNRPLTLDLADLTERRPRREVDFTLECSGNTGLPFFIGGIGNARWAGAPVSSVLKRWNIAEGGTEVVFWGADEGQVTIRDNAGVLPLNEGSTGTTTPDSTGGLDLTITERFARSMSVKDALAEDNLLCYEMNGEPLPHGHGFPVRLIAPGWYGVANVKWLTRIEVRDGRHAGRFMARDYVTIRELEHSGETLWTFTTVGRDRLKSAPAKVTRAGDRYTIMGAAWGAPIRKVEVQIDEGPWQRARLRRHRSHNARAGYAWVFWTLKWPSPTLGRHTVRSRAFDVDGNGQPAPDDPFLASKVTYWESNGQITRTVVIT